MSDPTVQFRAWLDEAIAAGEPIPNAMALATANAQGVPSVRIVLLEDVTEAGFAFQTNLNSPKVADLELTGLAAATFFWPRLLRQVRVSGAVTHLHRDEVARYFNSQPPGIQAMLRACRVQSEVIPDRATLEQRFADALNSHEAGVPDHWGGYRLHVASIEFWQGRDNWLQDRLRYTRTLDEGWRIERLVP